MSVRALLTVAVLVLAASGCRSHSQSTGDTGPSVQRPALLANLRSEFLKVNPRIQRVYVLEVRPNPMAAPGDEYALLATGIAPNPAPEVDFSNELFGVFAVDPTLTRVLRVMEIFPTRRWRDYWVRFEFIGPDSLIVRGSGRAYGDEPLVRTYSWALRQHDGSK
jgi:hypothetical protein